MGRTFSAVTLFSALLSLLSTTYAAPTSFSVASPAVDINAPLYLYTVDRPNAEDTDGTGVSAAVTANNSFTALALQQPDGPATDGQRFLGPAACLDEASQVNVLGGYIRSSLPIPRSDPLEYANWTSINDNAFDQEGAPALGGRVNFTTVNQGADGGVEVDGRTGALYLHAETDNWAAFKLCDQEQPAYLAFAGTASADCKDVYLIGTNN